ncbi:MAG: cysteine-rich CWC family protein [Rubrivivax sp.]|jgi:hypothetical protein
MQPIKPPAAASHADLPISASACPLCGQGNACQMAAGGDVQSCWCQSAHFSTDLLARVPAAARGRACICAACAQASAAHPPTTP